MVDDADHATRFYSDAFGAVEVFRVARPDGSVLHAELAVEGSVFMVGDAAPPFTTPTAGGTTVVLHAYVEDVDGLRDRCVRAGVEVLQEPTDMFYGDAA